MAAGAVLGMLYMLGCTGLPSLHMGAALVFLFALCLAGAIILTKRKKVIPERFYTRWLPLFAICFLACYCCLFVANVRALAARHMDTDLLYAWVLFLMGAGSMAAIAARLLQKAKVPALMRLLPALYLAAGVACAYLASVTPCCTGG